VPQKVDLGIWSRLTLLVKLLILAAVGLGIFVSYVPVIQQNERMQKHIVELEQQIKVLEAAIHRLRSDPKTVERMAREKLGYAKPGESVIYFEAPKIRPAAER
jgi:cell division protein FtsB